jgi:hypothetical protein
MLTKGMQLVFVSLQFANTQILGLIPQSQIHQISEVSQSSNHKSPANM